MKTTVSAVCVRHKDVKGAISNPERRALKDILRNGFASPLSKGSPHQ